MHKDLGEIKVKTDHPFLIVTDHEIKHAVPDCGCTNVEFRGKQLSGSLYLRDYPTMALVEGKPSVMVQKTVRLTYVNGTQDVLYVNASLLNPNLHV